MILAIILPIILAIFIAKLVIFILGIISISKLSDESTPENIRTASILSPLAFGWFLGLIVFFLLIMPKTHKSEEAKKAATSGVSIGAGIDVVLGIILFSLAFMLAVSEPLQETSTNHPAPSKNQPTSINNTSNKTKKEIQKNENPISYNVDNNVFSAKMPCNKPMETTEDGHKIFMCVSGSENAHMIMYSDLPNKIDEANHDAFINAFKEEMPIEYNTIHSVKTSNLFGKKAISIIGVKDSMTVRQDIILRNLGEKTQIFQILYSQSSPNQEVINAKFNDLVSNIKLK